MITTVHSHGARTPTRRWVPALLLGAVLGLASCGSNETETEIYGIAKEFGTKILSKDTGTGQQAALQVTRAQVDASTVPVIRVRLEGTGAMSTMIQVDRKGPNTTFMTGDGVGLLFRAGVLIGTRGLGQDLMGLSAPDIRSAIRAGETTRTYRYLDGDEKLVDVTLRCQISSEAAAPVVLLGRSHKVEQITESCRGTGAEGAEISFENFYWVSPGTGQIWQSRQYVSPKFGRAEIEVLKAGK